MPNLFTHNIGDDWNGIKIGVRFVVRFNILYSNDLHKSVYQITAKRYVTFSVVCNYST